MPLVCPLLLNFPLLSSFCCILFFVVHPTHKYGRVHTCHTCNTSIQHRAVGLSLTHFTSDVAPIQTPPEPLAFYSDETPDPGAGSGRFFPSAQRSIKTFALHPVFFTLPFLYSSPSISSPPSSPSSSILWEPGPDVCVSRRACTAGVDHYCFGPDCRER